MRNILQNNWSLFLKKKEKFKSGKTKAEEMCQVTEETWQENAIPAPITLIEMIGNGIYSNQKERNSPEYYQVYENGANFEANEINF